MNKSSSCRAITEVALLAQISEERGGTVGRLALVVGRNDEEHGTVGGDLVEILEVVLFGIAYERTEPEFRLGLFRETDGVVFGRTGLGTVEYRDALLLHVL